MFLKYLKHVIDRKGKFMSYILESEKSKLSKLDLYIQYDDLSAVPPPWWEDLKVEEGKTIIF